MHRPIRRRRLRRAAVVLDKGADAIDGVGGDPPAIAQPRGELAVIDGAPPERGFGKPGLPAIGGDFLKQLLRGHRRFLVGPRLRLERAFDGPTGQFQAMMPRSVNHEIAHSESGTKMGYIPPAMREPGIARSAGVFRS